MRKFIWGRTCGNADMGTHGNANGGELGNANVGGSVIDQALN